MEKLELRERKRVLKCIKDFVTPDGAVITFQKDAWNNLRNSQNNAYDIIKAKNAQLTGSVIGMPEIALYCVPPTRLSGPAGNVLKQYLSRQIKWGDAETNSDIGFIALDAAVFNNQGNVTVLVSKDGGPYTLIGSSFVKTFSSSDNDNQRDSN